MTDIKRMEKPTDLICEKCGKPLVIKWGKHGSFIACTGYPDCTYTRELTVDLPDVDKADLAEQGDEEYCENCGRPMVLKKGRFGTFYACTGYPDCKTTKPIGGQQKKPDQPLEETCPQCGSNLVLKSGRFGEFTACSNYPTCKYVKQKTIGVKCPECSEGEIIERRSRKGKTFYGCNRYPDCKFVAWGKPVAGEVPGMRQPVHGGEVAEGRARCGSVRTPSASTSSPLRNPQAWGRRTPQRRLRAGLPVSAARGRVYSVPKLRKALKSRYATVQVDQAARGFCSRDRRRTSKPVPPGR